MFSTGRSTRTLAVTAGSALIGLVLLCSWSGVAHLGAADVDCAERRVARALEFIAKAFPELATKEGSGVHVQVISQSVGLDGPRRPFEFDFAVRVATSADDLLRIPIAALDGELLYVGFEYAAHDIRTVRTYGRLVKSAEKSAINPGGLLSGLSDEEKHEWLRKAGVRVGPEEREAVRQHLPIEAIEVLLGRINVLDTTFGAASWYTEVERVSDGTRFHVHSEPFGWRMTGLSRAYR
jgi:hypothetical protein